MFVRGSLAQLVEHSALRRAEVSQVSEYMYWVYILESLKDYGYYTGSTSNLDDRLERHYSGRSKATKARLPLELVYKKGFQKKSEALRFERYIKRRKSKQYIAHLIRDHAGR